MQNNYGAFISQSSPIWLRSWRIKTHMEEKQTSLFQFRFVYESCVTGLENLEVTEILASKKLSKKHLPFTLFT